MAPGNRSETHRGFHLTGVPFNKRLQPAAPGAITKALEQRTAALFSREDMRQALTIQGDYIRVKNKK